MLEIIKIENTVKKRYRNYRYFYTNIEIVFNDVIFVSQKDCLKRDFKILPQLPMYEEYEIIDIFIKKNKIQLVTTIPYFYVNSLTIYSLAYSSNIGIQGEKQGIIYKIEPIPLDNRLLMPYVNFIECAEVDEIHKIETYAMNDFLRYRSYRFETNFFYLKDFFGAKTYYDKKVAFRFRVWAEHEMTERFLVRFFGRIYLYVNGELCYQPQTGLKEERFLEESIQCVLKEEINVVDIFYDPLYFAKKDPLNRIIGLSVQALLEDNQDVLMLV